MQLRSQVWCWFNNNDNNKNRNLNCERAASREMKTETARFILLVTESAEALCGKQNKDTCKNRLTEIRKRV